MLYRFEDGNPREVCRVKNIQTVWYDMDDGDTYELVLQKVKSRCDHYDKK